MFWDEFSRAFRFALLERRDHNGRPTARVSFTPDPSYRPRGIIDTEYLPRIAGQLWIDEQETEIARLELRFERDHKIGLGTLGSINRGTAYSMELAKQVQGFWLPKRAETDWHVRKLVVSSHERFTVDFGNYRRFTVDSGFTVK
jgi:hypothetical protein